MSGGILPSERVAMRLRNELLQVSRGDVRTRQLRGEAGDRVKNAVDMHHREVMAEVRAHEANGVPLAEKCEVCGFRHGIGRACLVPRVIGEGERFGDWEIQGMSSAARGRAAQQRRQAIRWRETNATRAQHGTTLDRHPRRPK